MNPESEKLSRDLEAQRSKHEPVRHQVSDAPSTVAVQPERPRDESESSAVVRGGSSERFRLTPDEVAGLRGQFPGPEKLERAKPLEATPENANSASTWLRADRAQLTPDEIAKLREASSRATAPLEGGDRDAQRSKYQKFQKELQSGSIEFKERAERYVQARDILAPKEYRDFWSHHGNTRETYDSMAEGYRAIRDQMGHGKSLDELRVDKNLRPAIEFWWSKHDPVSLYHYQGNYIADSGFHRIALAQALDLGEIPAEVIEAQLREVQK